MKKAALLTLVILIGNIAFAQGRREEQKDKIRTARIEFIKNKLALTPEEEKNFIPLYTAMLDEMEALRKEYTEGSDLRDVDLTFMGDAECEKLINDIIVYKEKELALMKKYNEAFKKVLPIKKVAMIYKAETEFKKELVKKLRQERK